ncbi:TadE/TadG family type IV pilus assembly protein [Hyphomonas sp.]|uniref:TadE/TadG family type IV pilus assembly protein n=1 Tax=Hyphomonas sp. TaxID=87 RepID=UPI00391AFD9B
MAGAQPLSLTARMSARWKRFADDRRGAAAVEFALIAAPFFFLIFGLLEVCMIFIMSTVMEHAVSEAARPLRTGEAQEAAMTQVQFRQSVCNEMFEMLDCDARLYIDVRTVSDFASSPIGSALDGSGDVDDTDFMYDPGGPNDIVAVRVFYEWDLITPYISQPLRNMGGNRHLLQANAVFRNEPFGS